MTLLYFVRHGRTEWNLEGRFQGSQADSPLLPSTLEDLQNLSEHLSSVPFDHIFSSDLPRAAKTAEAILEKQAQSTELTLTPELREWQLGKLEGTKVSLMQSLYPKQHHAFRHNLAKFNPRLFEAESVFMATQRMGDFVKAQKELNADHLLFVSHGAISTASIRSLLGYNTAELRKAGGLSNSSVTILETEDFENFKLLLWNDTSFLPSNQDSIISSSSYKSSH
ncbi:histidine phosphatase family protein [Streptococcus merionis]|uniref:histidine phosphatase family protein n=1 Tax=Streptococcus merionis TaxID=400065 RepID=UPI003518835A